MMMKRMKISPIFLLRSRNDMSAFKDMVQEDIKNIFLDFDMFGEIHKLDGMDVLVIVDESELVEREKRTKDVERGLHNRQILFYVAAEDFGEIPSVGRMLKFDGEDYLITDVTDESGVYSISLEVPQSW